MAKPKFKIYELVALIELHAPISPNRLTDITGDHRQSIDQYIRQARNAGLIHISGYEASPYGGNRTVKLYSPGKGIDAERVYAKDRRQAETIAKIQEKHARLAKCARRDPFIEAMYGSAA